MEDATGTVVQLPPPPTASSPATMNEDPIGRTSTPIMSNKKDTSTTTPPPQQSTTSTATPPAIAARNTAREERKRQLLLEARKHRIDWILGGVTDDTDLKQVLNKKNPLRELHACSLEGVKCAPEVVEVLFSSKLEGDGDVGGRIANEVKRILEGQKLSWDNVSSNCATFTNNDNINESNITKDEDNDEQSLLSPAIPNTKSYNIFLQTLCQPNAADVVFSMQKFCKTIEEAARVILSVLDEEKLKVVNEKVEREKMKMMQNQHPLNDGDVGEANKTGVQVRFSDDGHTQQQQTPPAHYNHAESLAKAVRGFIKTTLREMQNHDAFKVFIDQTNANMDEEATKEELMACLETFVFTKCHGSIYHVLGAEMEHQQIDESVQSEMSDEEPTDAKTAEEADKELQEKMKLLQFVTPEHLEIQCLKHSDANTEQGGIDLSYSIDQIKSIQHQSSPRSKLQCILLAHRGINASLNSVLKKQQTTPSPSPPSADDVLPTLILAVLRSQPQQINVDLRFIEHFSTPQLLRGEAGYAYTNLCGAVHFLQRLDMDSHAAEVSLGEGAVLHIAPEEFRRGIEECRLSMGVEDKLVLEGDENGHIIKQEADTIQSSDNLQPPEMNISGLDIRQARLKGETIDLNWALQKQKSLKWQHGKVQTLPSPPDYSNLPPEHPPLPPNFIRSYSFLSTHPDDIKISDLPKLLNEYRMLVHATEGLLNERSGWIEGEKRRRREEVRVALERDYNELIGGLEMNGFSDKK